jgi:DNA-binding response OmpR family regulator
MNEILMGLIIASGGSLINFISTKIYNRATGKSKNFLWKDRGNLLMNLKTPMDFEELKKRVRIVVIDDEDGFPLKLFQSDGYAIDKWDKVLDYSRLESGFYDIIVLDIKGVAQDISEEDGLGVLEGIKSKNPAQIIIAYSQHSYDLSKVRFWELADEKIAKPSDFIKIKSKIDNLITTKYKPERYIHTLHQLLSKSDFGPKEIRALDSDLSKLIKSKAQPDWNSILEFAKKKTETVSQIISIGNTILKFFH